MDIQATIRKLDVMRGSVASIRCAETRNIKRLPTKVKHSAHGKRITKLIDELAAIELRVHELRNRYIEQRNAIN